MPEETIRTAFTLSAIALSFAVLTTTIEFLSMLKEFDRGGAFCWKVLQLFTLHPLSPVMERFREAIFGRRGTAAILTVRLFSAVALLAGALLSHRFLCLFALTGVLATNMLVSYRCRVGLEGADVMSTIVAAGLLVTLAGPSSARWTAMGFGFIALQSCLSYVTAGVAKLLSSDWRDGKAVYGIANTETYGSEMVALVLRDNRLLKVGGCWIIMLFETAFPLVLLLPRDFVFSILILGVAFHLANAVFMGLNGFLWAFLATYPAIWYCNRLIGTFLGRA